MAGWDAKCGMRDTAAGFWKRLQETRSKQPGEGSDRKGCRIRRGRRMWWRERKEKGGGRGRGGQVVDDIRTRPRKLQARTPAVLYNVDLYCVLRTRDHPLFFGNSSTALFGPSPRGHSHIAPPSQQLIALCWFSAIKKKAIAKLPSTISVDFHKYCESHARLHISPW